MANIPVFDGADFVISVISVFTKKIIKALADAAAQFALFVKEYV